MNNINFKTMVPPIVAAGVSLVEIVTGHTVSKSLVSTITTDTIGFLTFAVTVWGIWKNHKKGVSK